MLSGGQSVSRVTITVKPRQQNTYTFMPTITFFSALMASLPMQPLFAQHPPFSPFVLLLILLFCLGPFMAAGLLWVAALFLNKTAAMVCLILAGLCFMVGAHVNEFYPLGFFAPAVLLLLVAIVIWFRNKSVAAACLIPIGLYFMLGFLAKLPIDVMLFRYFICPVLPLIATIIIWFRNTSVVIACTILSGLFLMYGSHLHWEDKSDIREARAKWATDVASNPDTLIAVGGSFLRDQDLQLLRNMTRLKHLELRSSLSGMDQLQYLTGLNQLQSLSLDGNIYVLNDTSLRHIEGLTQLQELNLDSCWNITDVGLLHIKALKQLRKLSLSDTRVTDSGLEHIAALTELRELSLGSTKITDAGLKGLSRLINLRELDISFDEVTYAGLEHLKALPKLTSLNIGSTNVTYDEVKKLQQALPNCKISN